MKRFSLAVLFFAILIGLWEWLYRAKVWSPVLLPAPEQVVEYLKTSITDGTLVNATVITMRRLLIGYAIGLVGGFFAYFTVGLRWYGKQEVQPWRLEQIPATSTPDTQSDAHPES